MNSTSTYTLQELKMSKLVLASQFLQKLEVFVWVYG